MRLLQLLLTVVSCNQNQSIIIQIVHCFNFWKCWLFHLSYFQEAAWFVADECIQILGGMGYMKVSDSTCNMLLCKIKGGTIVFYLCSPPSPLLPSPPLSIPSFLPFHNFSSYAFFPTDFFSSYKLCKMFNFARNASNVVLTLSNTCTACRLGLSPPTNGISFI